MKTDRRRATLGLLTASAWLAGLCSAPQRSLAAVREAVAALPGKVALRRLTHRPPNYETPLEHFRSTLTPNDAFFVRYHHAGLPSIDAGEFRLEVGGAAARPAAWSLEQLRRDFPANELVAVCQCSGNRRGLFDPPVPGLQWGHGAMGNARWRGVRLADLLERAGLAPTAVEIAFDAADFAPLEGTPDYVKSLPLAKALHPDTLLAYEMNGAPLPELNGFPLRLVVPGWTATYWIKHVNRITALDAPEKGFWMSSAYRMPRAAFPLIERFPTQEVGERAPVTEIAINSLVTSMDGDGVLRSGASPLRGIAWDSGRGIDRVELSFDAGASWRRCELGEDLGAYSFRPWTAAWPTLAVGRHELWVRAANKAGQVQVERAIPNPSGYQHNAYHRVPVEVSA
ncbi:MAG: molybdopterin-dependent oxidoreductase [Gammaproteobacteria bacterium]|nr:molybdopterin-dependent oxidoreductase [Gammaproteobacteria bacterium]